MKVIVIHSSELVREAVGAALEAAGHSLCLFERPEALLPEDVVAGALVAEAAQVRHAARILRERGFHGRVLSLGGGEGTEHADGELAPGPLEDLAERFAKALPGRRRVLIVDDSELAATLLRGELEGKGFDVSWADDAEKATSMILRKATRPDLVLLDLNMPRVDGASFCRFLKKNSLFAGVKVVLCSGESPDKVAATARECGADGFVLKSQILAEYLSDQLAEPQAG